MKGMVKRNFETGKLLLVAALLLSLNLVLQLFAVADTIDLTNGIHLSGMSLTLTASYLLTAVSMIIVLQEFFQVKTKIRGLIELNTIIAGVKAPKPFDELEQTEPLVIPEIQLETAPEEEVFDEIALDPDAEFESLLNDELDDEAEIETDTGDDEDSEDLDVAFGNYNTRKLRFNEETGEMEPIVDSGELQNLLSQAELESDESQQLAKLMEDSEVIRTLNELEDIVEELKNKKAAKSKPDTPVS